MTQLYVLTEQFRELQALAVNADEDMAVAVRDTMQAIEGEFEEKGKALAVIVLNMDTDVEALDKEIERLTERKRAIKNRQESLKDYLRENMEAAGIKKISCPLFSITCAEGREIAVVDDESLLPDEFMRVKTDVAPDKAEIAKALKAGTEVPGAHLERTKSSIRIK
ncbi:siphovirus Gp157 family protein [Pseudomonas sp. PI1]|uniref:siphovirus Gp157 family protein n=1 Tax=Pseudomonas sp. PI1 TaxID=1582493 RepID=UPI0005BC6FE5|nr:siphovirus Gp157 family protein [Pseudomonas sp. PI1]KWR82518.1 hypothetical protein RN02_08930 [Pseudomonas sp. PI1]